MLPFSLQTARAKTSSERILKRNVYGGHQRDVIVMSKRSREFALSHGNAQTPRVSIQNHSSVTVRDV